MSNLIVRFVTYIKGGGVLTFVGSRIFQGVYWEALVYDPVKDSYWPGVGSLQKDRTYTDKSSLSTNVYTAPTKHPIHRWGTGYKWGEKKWAEEWDVNDHVRVKWNN